MTDPRAVRLDRGESDRLLEMVVELAKYAQEVGVRVNIDMTPRTIHITLRRPEP